MKWTTIGGTASHVSVAAPSPPGGTHGSLLDISYVYRLKKQTIDLIVQQIHDFMRELATSFPNLVTVTNQGQSHEGRDMLMLKISSGGAAKNAIFVDGGPLVSYFFFLRSIS